MSARKRSGSSSLSCLRTGPPLLIKDPPPHRTASCFRGPPAVLTWPCFGAYYYARSNLLFLGVGVLILTDRSYLSRFWCSFEVSRMWHLELHISCQSQAEARSHLLSLSCVRSVQAWLAMQDVSKHGLVSARSSSRTQRCSIVTMHGGAPHVWVAPFTLLAAATTKQCTLIYRACV